MGSTGTFRPRGMTDIEFFSKELGEGREIIAHGGSHTSGEWSRVFYAAVRNPDGLVWPLVVLIKQGSSRSYINFYYKEMDDTVGPNEAQCPANVLDLLSPTTSEYALEWRARCRAHIEYRKSLPKLKRNDTVHFEKTWYFTNGESTNDLFFIERNRFKTPGGTGVRLPQIWREYSHEKVTA